MPATSTAATPCRRPRSTAKAARLLAAILVSSPALTTTAAEITRRAPDDVAGRDPAAGAAFAARTQGDAVTVELGLRGGKRITARIDHAAGIVRLRSLAAGPDGTEAPAPVERADLRALGALPREFGELPSGNARDALEGLLALLDEAPPGIVLDVDRKADIRSLCGVRRATGSYTLGDLRVSTRVAVGPCYISSMVNTSGNSPSSIRAMTPACTGGRLARISSRFGSVIGGGATGLNRPRSWTWSR
jgi:hypothetical protein